tara:strand:+ start:5710 stop:7074 length:1365 start_codon:yes stop_codon:yes gene_type:complete
MKQIGEIMNQPIRTAISIGDNSSTNKLDEMEDRAVCIICSDARFVRVTKDLADPKFGKVEPCVCSLYENDQTRKNRLERYSQLGPLKNRSFEDIDRTGRLIQPSDQGRYREAVELIEHFAEYPVGWLVITGAHGVGKSHLAAAVVTRLIENGEPGLFANVADFLDELRSTYDDENETQYNDIIEKYKEAPLLVLDDLGSYSFTNWAEEKLMQIVTHRFDAKNATIFTCREVTIDTESRIMTKLLDPGISQVVNLGIGSTSLLTTTGAMESNEIKQFQFDNFDPKARGLKGEHRKNLEGVLQLAMHWSKKPEGWLVFLGGNGCGKTHLAAAITGYRILQGEDVAFANVPDLLDDFRATFNNFSSNNFEVKFRKMKEVSLLVLDDMGAQNSSSWAEEKLYQLVNYRHLKKSPTIITTNCKLGDIQPRIASRLADIQISTVYEITAPDYRIGGTKII